MTPTAEQDLAEIDRTIAESSVTIADRFLLVLQAKLESLEHFPRRGAIARESRRFGRRIRQLLVHRYRILYHIRGRTVFILRIGHGHRRSLPPFDAR